MDGQRMPNKTRQITPSRPANTRSADDHYARSARSSSPENRRGNSGNNSSRDNRRNGRDGRNGSNGAGRSNGNNGNNGYRRRSQFRENWRHFGEQVRDFTGQLPLARRAAGNGRRSRRSDRNDRRQQDIDRGWREEEQRWDERPLGEATGETDGYGNSYGDGYSEGFGGAYNDAPGLFPPETGESFGIGDADGRPMGSRDRARGANGSSPLKTRKFSIKLISVLALLSIIVGFCCTQSTLTVVDTASAAVDARAQANAIEGILKGGNAFDTSHLGELQSRLAALNSDLARIQGALPGPIVNTTAGRNLDQTLTMATHLVQAGRYGVDAALILVPHLKGALGDVGSSASTPATTGTPGAKASPTATPTTPTVVPGGLTQADMDRVQQDITIAGNLVQQALVERQAIDDSQLTRIGLGSVASILHKIDGFAPKLPTYLGYADNIVQALPTLLGVTKPAHFLLFNIDSDEMRATGGFMGNYALITVQNGRVIGGVHLRDTFAFDCPGGTDRCVAAGPPIPPEYAWMNAFPESFRMRDSNVSPDFPTSAKLIMQKYQDEGGQPVDGIVMITPEIIKDILKVTGSLKVDGFDQQVDAKNLQDVIHYYHILNRNNFGKVGGNSAKKAIDAQLGSALLHKVGQLSAQQQAALMKSILEGFNTRDVQVYFNDPRIEGVLSALHMDSTITMPAGMDGLMVSDNNTGATYYSRDMLESVVDTITIDSQGVATHDMTLTYKLPLIQHLYTPIYVDNNGSSLTWYTGVTRVIVPETAQPIDGRYVPDGTPTGTMTAMQVDECNITANQSIPGCPLLAAPEPGHQVWAARINNMQVGTDSVIFHMKWTTPNVLKTVDGKKQYNLRIYKQAGSHIAYDIKIIPPTGAQVLQPLVSPLKTPTGVTPGTFAEFTSPSLVKDILLTAIFIGG